MTDSHKLAAKTAIAHWSETPLRAEDFASETWRAAESAKLTQYWSGAEAPSERHAEAKIIWSAEALHVRFECRQNEPLVVSANPQTLQKTVGLWDRDVCEIFVAPDLSHPHKYFEFEAAPTGEWLDVAIDYEQGERHSDWEFHSAMTVAAQRSAALLTISMRIPWSNQLPKPYAGENWRLNLFRCIGTGVERGYLAWEPTFTEVPGFHVPERFGWLVFV